MQKTKKLIALALCFAMVLSFIPADLTDLFVLDAGAEDGAATIATDYEVGATVTNTGNNAKPIAIGGGTYARALKCGCAFGPEIPGVESTIHQANEYVTFDCIRLMSDVYYTALKSIALPAEESNSEKAGVKLGSIRLSIGKEPKEGATPIKLLFRN